MAQISQAAQPVVDLEAAEPLVARILDFAGAHLWELGVFTIVVAALVAWGRRGRH